MGSIASGITGAAPIWNKIMIRLLEERPDEKLKQPDTVVGKIVCATSGLLPPPDGTPDRCPVRYELFVKGTEPRLVDAGKQKVFIDKATGDLAKPGQTDNIEEREVPLVTDPTGDRYCLTCPHPEQEQAKQSP